MGKVIQMIRVADDAALFITDYDTIVNPKTHSQKISFRSSRDPKQLHTEEISIDTKGMVRTNLYFFHMSYLQKFINENNLVIIK